jgi:hypothetical protein
LPRRSLELISHEIVFFSHNKSASAGLSAAETIIRTTQLFTCNRAKEIWQRLGVWNKIERLMEIDRFGSVVVAEVMSISRPLKKLKQVGLAELILTEG